LIPRRLQKQLRLGLARLDLLPGLRVADEEPNHTTDGEGNDWDDNDQRQ
jgi:hypothetical protein